MRSLALAIAAAPLVIALYAYVGYPVILVLLAKFRSLPTTVTTRFDWPSVTVTVPVYNAAASIATTIERLLELDYPADRLQLLVISDASTDGTDQIVRSFANRGVELLRLPRRLGKTTAENSALANARGELIVNVDATILVPSDSLKRLVRVFDDPTIGVASGRDVSVGDAGHGGTGPESSYVGYEMWIRDLETKTGSIVGASGCFYAIRRSIHAKPLPHDLSWDFASVLVARLQGFRSVSVPAAVCMVPRTSQIGTELKRKVRTMARGINTLFYHRELMNPMQYGGFALMLVSHKLLRWLPYLLAPFALLALGFLAVDGTFARVLLVTVLGGLVVGAGSIRGTASRPRPLMLAGFLVAAFYAGLLAWWNAFRRTPLATWNPTPRPEAQT